MQEQAFAVHYGQGRNGKSTLLDLVAGVLGSYAGVAALGLLMSGSRDRHPTEIADLAGRRMVTAHETGEGGVLREEFVKQATGGDLIKGCYMRGFLRVPACAVRYACRRATAWLSTSGTAVRVLKSLQALHGNRPKTVAGRTSSIHGYRVQYFSTYWGRRNTCSD